MHTQQIILLNFTKIILKHCGYMDDCYCIESNFSQPVKVHPRAYKFVFAVHFISKETDLKSVKATKSSATPFFQYKKLTNIRWVSTISYLKQGSVQIRLYMYIRIQQQCILKGRSFVLRSVERVGLKKKYLNFFFFMFLSIRN